ncbi:MAG: HD domain-containing protein [Candidatus Omnitrophica bacterium]|nr:HD domain-containing protein [Candidatus Omnitrophota bacterium]MDD5655170.1 HD domain-containing protein [Candidatus Omnitrophota bacterium]
MTRSNKEKKIINFLAEAGQLKRVKRSGWWVIGIKDPESVAEHCFRCAVLGYILAKMEKANPYKVTMMALFNDIHEARINDLHKMGHSYIDFREAEMKVFKEQAGLLPPVMGDELSSFRGEYDKQSSKEAVIARDADILECVFQAKEYLESGVKDAQSFIDVGKKYLKSKSAKALARSMRTWKSKDWWFHLKKFER